MVSFRFPPLNYQKPAELITTQNNIRIMTNENVKKTMRLAAIIIPVVALVALIPVYRSKKMQQEAGFKFLKQESLEMPIEETVTAQPKDTSIGGELEQSTDKRVALFYDETPVKAVTKPQQTEGYTFYIITGSFKDEINAKKLAKEFMDNGYQGVEVIQSDNLYRVSLNSFDDKVKALHELRRIRSDEQNTNAWLLAKK